MSTHLSIYLFLSVSLFSLSLSAKPPCRVWDDYYVNECDWREGRRDWEGRGSNTPHGEYFCSSFHYLALSFPGSPLSPRRRNILISVTATHTLCHSVLLDIFPPIQYNHSSIHLSLYVRLQWKGWGGANVQRKAFNVYVKNQEEKHHRDDSENTRVLLVEMCSKK